MVRGIRPRTQKLGGRGVQSMFCFCEHSSRPQSRGLRATTLLECKSMRPLLRELSIQWDPSAPHTPSGNGIAERMVRTVTERLRATSFGSELDEDFWPEALPTVVKNSDRTRREFKIGLIGQLERELAALGRFSCPAQVAERQMRTEKSNSKPLRIPHPPLTKDLADFHKPFL
uniref:Integrase catalytic domain-containing protein n=1 Tax=Rhodosorus marinus TaxID=101924 RepID=A0A7S2ZDE2_9RHOD|mmetsp:Transcript_15538/g.63335  ORF Transcript_15538/g.63335 Transcript_15538/m.63335 type:complete len:173 (+) Transcript_15538:1428-1946(+)